MSLDRTALQTEPLSRRENRVRLPEAAIDPDAAVAPPPDDLLEHGIRELAAAIRAARSTGAPRVLAYGAHLIKNGLGTVLIRLIEEGWISGLATNGAGIIHDWELAFQGATSEDVRDNIANGRFGLWEETGRYLNLALAVGALRKLGYGEAVGALIHHDGLEIPSERELCTEARQLADTDPEHAAAACDLLTLVRRFALPAGRIDVAHPYRAYSVQAAAYRLRIPCTGHPMFGHDIIYTHPMNHGAAVGRTAERDFLRFAGQVAELDGGVYLSVGSAVMSPMIFEKSFAMANNLALQKGMPIDSHSIFVVDLSPAPSVWEHDIEPETDDPAYYLRFLKTFNRMGGRMRYLCGDNRTVLPRLYRLLKEAPQ